MNSVKLQDLEPIHNFYIAFYTPITNFQNRNQENNPIHNCIKNIILGINLARR